MAKGTVLPKQELYHKLKTDFLYDKFDNTDPMKWLTDPPAVLAKDVWEEGIVFGPHFDTMHGGRHAQPHPIFHIGQAWGAYSEVNHGHDHIPLAKRFPKLAELIAGGEHAGATIAIWISLLTCGEAANIHT